MKEDGREKDTEERYRYREIDRILTYFFILLYIIAYYIYIYIYTIDHSDGLSLVMFANSIEQVITLLCNISNVCSNFLSFE